MYLWHPNILSRLPKPLLCGLHRDCCRLRGQYYGHGWKLQWLWKLSWVTLVWYHRQVLAEMADRGWHYNPQWMRLGFRGKNLEPLNTKWYKIDAAVAGCARNAWDDGVPEGMQEIQGVARLSAWEARHG